MRNAQRGGALKHIVILLALGVGVWLLFSGESNTPGAKIERERQSDPEMALKYYLEVAYKFMHAEPDGTFDDVQRAVTKDDWEWYKNNKDHLADRQGDAWGLRTAANPTDVGAIERRGVMEGILSFGPNRTDFRIMDRQISATRAVFSLKSEAVILEEEIYKKKLEKAKAEGKTPPPDPREMKKLHDPSGLAAGYADLDYTIYSVEVVKEGKFWKVKDFAGGRSALTR